MAVDRRAARLGVLAVVGAVLFGLLGVRLWFLQTVKADELQFSTTQAQTRTVRLAPERGRIFDTDGRILAGNERILTVAVDWQVIRRKSERDELFGRLSGWLDVPVEEMEDRYTSKVYSPFLPLPLRENVDEGTAIALLERIEDFPGVSIETDWKRVYPYAPHAAHVVGYMGAITPEQLDERLDQGYLRNERVGQFGVEAELEELLHGSWGYRIIEVDAANRPVRTVSEVPPINGFDVQLSIDLDLQQYAEQTLETTLDLRRQQTAPNPKVEKPDGTIERMDIAQGDRVYYKAPAGSVVAMDYSNGQILAMASYPTFDNRWFEADISGTKFKEIFPPTDDPDKSILVNRAVQGRYNLGSTFKPFTAYAALDTGLITPNYFFTDTGYYTLGPESVDVAKCVAGLIRCTYKNAVCGNGLPCKYGPVNVEQALAVSSDAFFYRIGEQIMVQNNREPVLQDQVELFGFGERSGVELPYEFKGTVPDKELKREYAERGVIAADEGQGYYVGDNVQLAIGQGLLSATPLQLANGYATIANHGNLYQPTVVKAIWNPGVPDGDEPGVVDLTRGTQYDPRTEPSLIRRIAMPDVIRDPIVNGLHRVIYGRGVTSDIYHKTTGENLFSDYPSDFIPLAGKTGTAQGAENYPWNDSSAFTAFSTDEADPFVVTAYLEKSGYGSQAAAPVVKCMFMSLSDPTRMDPVVASESLDVNATVAAPSMGLTEQQRLSCQWSKTGDGVVTDTRTVE